MEDMFEIVNYLRDNIKSTDEARLLVTFLDKLKDNKQFLDNKKMVKIIRDVLLLIDKNDNNQPIVNKVCGLFECYSDVEGKIHFKLLHICNTLDNAISYSQLTKHLNDFNPAHHSMTKDNNFTYIGDRDNCVQHKQYGQEHLKLGGYVIEQFHIN